MKFPLHREKNHYLKFSVSLSRTVQCVCISSTYLFSHMRSCYAHIQKATSLSVVKYLSGTTFCISTYRYTPVSMMAAAYCIVFSIVYLTNSLLMGIKDVAKIMIVMNNAVANIYLCSYLPVCRMCSQRCKVIRYCQLLFRDFTSWPSDQLCL